MVLAKISLKRILLTTIDICALIVRVTVDYEITTLPDMMSPEDSSMSDVDTPRTRIAVATDVDRLQELHRELDVLHQQLIPTVFMPVDGDARSWQAVLQRIEHAGSDYIVLELGGSIVGFAGLTTMRYPDLPMFRQSEYAYLEDMLVIAAHQGQGFGKVLMAAAIDWARAAGFEHLQTTVWAANGQASAFYDSVGFQTQRRRLQLEL